MNHTRTSRRRLASSVAAVLAVTAGTLAMPTVATAETPQAVAAPAEQEVASIPPGSLLTGNGPSGFVTRLPAGEGSEYRWTRYSDGVTTALPAGNWKGSLQSDIVVKSEGTTHTLYDMGPQGATPVVIDTSSLGTSAQIIGLTDTTLVMTVAKAGGARDIHLVGKPEGTLLDRKVTGLPEDTVPHWYRQVSPDTMALLYTGTVGGVSGKRVAVVDLATAAVVDDRATPAADRDSSVSASATHVAWTEMSAGGDRTLVVARRGEAEAERVPLGTRNPVRADLLGDWVTYGVAGGATATTPDPLYSLTARSLRTGQTVKLLDTLMYVRNEPGGEALVQGGTLAQGEGVFRIAPGPDGTPTAVLVASTGKSLVLGAKTQGTPTTVVDFSRGAEARLLWEFDKAAQVRVVLTHTASGKRWTAGPSFTDGPGLTGAIWNGVFDDKTSAYNGDYTWQMTARPANGIGPSVERTGTLEVVSMPAPHDFSDSGVPDLLVRDGAGRLINYDARQTLFESGQWGTWSKPTQVVMGTGWQIYDRVAAPGNLDASPYADIIGRDRNGALWFYSGTGHGLAARKQIGTGWQIYDRITGGSDLTGDGRADLVATDKAGGLWLYPGTGNANAPFSARKKIGTGWGIYNQITATGNIAGAPAGDLVARDKDGVLWLYLGKGDGTFAPRTRVGAGWDRYTDIVGVGDTDRDGRPDLVVQGVMGGSHETLALHKGTGDWRAPFGSRTGIYTPEPLRTGPVTLF
ncbi:VCBS repeat-containing protein [Streptomyces sp. ISL-36]|uniref:FG-GAP repeat domain-containing protein n=1 Tax=Streptomyces sp. ISL-36 TaxID=2819182 RepID=UPI001BEB8209|nr:FG-GAP-like repeat-containing protein [Streptomyces sp. ISL-36]MBT2443939.1 VCBS repeat-containing protein [Streptomyces sp. ISL-36]